MKVTPIQIHPGRDDYFKVFHLEWKEGEDIRGLDTQFCQIRLQDKEAMIGFFRRIVQELENLS